MENYIDDSFAVTNKTIITYCGQHPIIKVPRNLDDIEISKIGDGSFMESFKLQCAILPPSIKEIGSQSFSRCPSLTSVFLPGGLIDVGSCAFSNCDILRDIAIYGLELSASEYYTLKNSANISNGEIYVLREMPENDLIKKIVSSISDAKPAFKIPSNISSLFHMTKFDEQKGKFSLEKNIPVIGFTVPSVPTSENKAFSEYLKNYYNEVYYSKVEEKNDWYVRVGKTPTKEKTIIFTFDDNKTKEVNGNYHINVTLKIGYFFWQSAQPVMYDNKKYYIYRRYYLSSDPDIEYVRRDIAVYSDRGLINNYKEAQNVYAKYKLLSML